MVTLPFCLLGPKELGSDFQTWCEQVTNIPFEVTTRHSSLEAHSSGHLRLLLGNLRSCTDGKKAVWSY